MNIALNLSIWFMIFVFQLPSSISSGVDEYHPGERDGLIQLRESLNSTSNLHSNWTGPPCYKNYSNWAGIACWNWHVVHIVLDGIQLTGSLPPTFLQNITFLSKLSLRNNSLFGPLPNLTNLLYLQFIFLSHNRFSGSIPLDLIHLPRLTKLELQENTLTGYIPPFNQPTLTVFNVSYNFLQGRIPETPILQSFPKTSYYHNSDLCGKPLENPCPDIPSAPPLTPPPPYPSPLNPSKNKNKKAIKVRNIVLIAIAAAVVPFMIMLVFLCYHKRASGKRKGEGEYPGTFLFLYLSIVKAQIMSQVSLFRLKRF